MSVAAASPISTSREFAPTDLYNARLFVSEHGQNTRSVPGMGWLVWEGRRWAVDLDGAVMRLAKATIDNMYATAVEDLAAAGNISDQGARKEAVAEAQRRLSHALKSQAEPRLRAMVSLAESEPEVLAHVGDFDQPPMLVNTPGGVYHLLENRLREHRREDLMTRITAASPDRDHLAPRWRSFLKEILVDEDRIAHLQRALGYSITGLMREQKIFLLLGEGNNGKSTLAQTIVKVLGDYAAEVNFETFLLRDNRSGTRGDLIRLRGKRFGMASEMNPGERLDTRRLKEWTGGEDVVARELYKNEISFKPVAKLWFLANHAPIVQDSSLGIWRRLVRIPFEIVIPAGRVDLELESKLLAEAPGIMWWLIEGCQAYLRDGLGEDPVAKAATAAWRADSDHIGRWMQNACILEPDAKCARRVLRANYTGWCEAEDERPVGPKPFAEELHRRGIVDGGTVRLNGRPVDAWRGIRIRDGLDVGRKDVGTVGGQIPKVSHEGTILELYPERPSTRPYATTREPGEDDEQEDRP